MDRIFIDTNIPMYWAGRESKYKQRCGDIMRAMTQYKVIGVTDTEVFQEILYRFMKIGMIEKGWGILDAFKEIISEVLPILPKDIYLTRQLSERYRNVKPRDILHAAVMINNGIKGICSVDRDLDGIKEIERLDPLSLDIP
ncbi:MAG: type II toxin-antitoxin system VapC family toxin [bacterium]